MPASPFFLWPLFVVSLYPDLMGYARSVILQVQVGLCANLLTSATVPNLEHAEASLVLGL